MDLKELEEVTRKLEELEIEKQSHLGSHLHILTKNNDSVHGTVIDIRLNSQQEQILVLGFVSINGIVSNADVELELMGEDIINVTLIDSNPSIIFELQNRARLAKDSENISELQDTKQKSTSDKKKDTSSGLSTFVPTQVIKSVKKLRDANKSFTGETFINELNTSTATPLKSSGTIKEQNVVSRGEASLKNAKTQVMQVMVPIQAYRPHNLPPTYKSSKDVGVNFCPVSPEGTPSLKPNITPQTLPIPIIYPVGHPKNTGAQNVYSARQYEIDYYELKDCFAEVVPCKHLVGKSGNFAIMNRNTRSPAPFMDDCISYVLNGKFRALSTGEAVSAFTPSHKHDLMQKEQKVGKNFLSRAIDIFGTCIFELGISMARIKIQKKDDEWHNRNVLVVAGSNFQGAASIVAAKLFNSKGLDVYLIALGSELPFEGTAKSDLTDCGAKLVNTLKEIKKLKFQVVIAGLDDFNSPTTSICAYKEFMSGASVILVDPPVIKTSYQSILEKMSEGLAASTALIYSIRPSPCNFSEGQGEQGVKIFVVNLDSSLTALVGRSVLEMIEILTSKKRRSSEPNNRSKETQ